MRAILEKSLFMFFFITTCVAAICALAPHLCMGACLAVDVVFLLYMWVRFSQDKFVHKYRKFIYVLLLVTMSAGSLLGRTWIPIIYLGPVFLAYIHMEGGYRV